MKLLLERLIDIYLGIPLVFLCSWVDRLFGKRKVAADRIPARALFIKFWGIGNIAMILPAVQSFKNRYPQAEVDLLTLRNNQEIARAAGLFRQVYVIDNGFLRLIRSVAKIIGELRGNSYDLIIDFEQFARISALLCRSCRGLASIGFNTRHQHRHYLYTTAVLYNNDIHMTRSFHSLVEAAGVAALPEIRPVPFAHDPLDRIKVKSLLAARGVADRDVLVLMHLGTSDNFIERRWPVEYYARLADRLVDAFSVRIVFTGVEKERSLIQDCFRRMEHNEQAVDLGGKLTFLEHLALWTIVDLAISADTSAVHLSSTMAVPAVGLYGPNTPVLYGPWGEGGIAVYKKLSCSPCITNYNAKISQCRHPEGRGACMAKITVDEVFDLVAAKYFQDKAPYRLKKLAA